MKKSILSYYNNYLTFTLIIYLIKQCYCHYPSEAVPRPCARKQYTVRFEGPICIPSNGSLFTKESEENCKIKLKSECPEFNQAHCIWYNLTIQNVTMLFPTCRLKYYANVKGIFQTTWMEIMYVNQFGTSERGIWPIIEIHRHIKEEKTFPFQQDDYPKNVPDPQGVQGLKWINVNLSKSALVNTTEFQPSSLCAQGADLTYCKVGVVQPFTVMIRNKEFGEYSGIEFLTPTAECSPYLINLKIVPVCRVKFQKESKYGDPHWTQTVVEGQAYYDGKNIIYRRATLGGNSIQPDGKTYLGEFLEYNVV